jgi:putative endonuclease
VPGAGDALGAWGERHAARWYAAHGFTVVDRNWRAPDRSGELDLVLARGDLLVICEVKTRSSAAFGSPAEAVTVRKQQRLRRLAAAWLAVHGGGWREVRFDVAAVRGAAIEILEGAF